MKELVSRVLGVEFEFDIKEIYFDGISIQYDGKSAVIGTNTKPAKARAYMLLAKAISEGKKEFALEEKANFDMCGVMLDMSFGSVSKVAGVKKYLDYMAIFGMNMLMLYTEDTYEIEGYPLFGYQRGRYSLEELKEIDDYAFNLGIEVIPCIQTFGHLGKFLRWKQHKNIAENDRVLLPGDENTYQFIETCIATCKKAFRSPRIHIGCDETHGLGFGKSFARDGLRDRLVVFNEHVARVVDICKKYDYRPMMWSDMYSTLASKDGKVYDPDIELPKEILDAVPNVDLVFWDYYKTENDFYHKNIIKHKKFNREVLFAGGIWTWNGQAPNFTHTYQTVKPALEECIDLGIRSVFAAAWAYGDINHIQATPCLAVYSEYCWEGKCSKEHIDDVAEFVTGLSPEMCKAISDFYCEETGDRNTGKLMIWGDPLIPLLPYGFDFTKIAEYYENALKVFEKNPNAPYVDFYKVLFRSALGKTLIHRDLHVKYKAGDREWLRQFKNVTLPELIQDMKTLYELHDRYWHEESKTHGFEKLANAYAAAIERLAYTGREIEKYLNGTIDVIEALEPEVLEGEFTKHLGATRVMSTY